MSGYGEVLPVSRIAGNSTSPELETWLADHHGAAWKFKAPKLGQLGKAKGAGKDRAFRDMVERYKYAVTETIDRRQIREPVELHEFLLLKSDPKYKPFTLPKPRVTLTKMSAAARADETRRVAAMYRPAAA